MKCRLGTCLKFLDYKIQNTSVIKEDKSLD